MLKTENALLLIVDVQAKLMKAMDNRVSTLGNMTKLAAGMTMLGVPIIVTEQNPAGLGPTVPEIASAVPGFSPISKLSFSCCDEPLFRSAIAAQGRHQLIVAGVEAHVCVYQTAQDLSGLGYQVFVVADAVASRTAENKACALEMVKQLGVRITTTEAALFELLRVAGGPNFKGMLGMVK